MLIQISKIKYQNDLSAEGGRAKFKNFKKFWTLLCIFGFWILIFGFLYGCQPRTYQKKTKLLMGTIVEVTSNDARAFRIVFDEISRIESLLSRYKVYSEVAALNRSGRLIVSPDTLYVIKKAIEFYSLSDGAFDITVAPLLDLWGFTDKKFRIPGKQEIKRVLRFVGSDKIIVDEKKDIIEFKLKGMEIDLGAIAKGYAVDQAVMRLKEAEIKSALINAGGDIYGLGTRSSRPWMVAIQDPRAEGFVDYIEIEDKAVVTSGDYEQYFKQGPRRFSHIFNPRTGSPADSGVISVTVIANDCLSADALATITFVLGEEKGEALAEEFGVKMEIITKDDV